MRTLGLELVRGVLHGEVDCGLPCRASLKGTSQTPAHLREFQPPDASLQLHPKWFLMAMLS